MTRKLIFFLLFTHSLAFGQWDVYMYGNKATTYGGGILISGFCPEYQVVYNAFTTKPGADTSLLQNAMVISLVNNLIWDEIDIFYLFALHNGVDAKINWGKPGTYNLTSNDLAAGSFTPYQGWAGDGVDGYFGTNWIPSTDGVNHQLTDCGVSYAVYNNVAEDTWDAGTFNGTYHSCKVKALAAVAAEVRGYLNTSSQDEIDNDDSRKHISVNRTSSSHTRYSLNKDHTTETVGGGTRGVSDEELYLLCTNNNGSPTAFTTHRMMYFIAHSSLSEDKADTLQDIMETYVAAVGSNLWGFLDSYKVVDDTHDGTVLANTGLGYIPANDYLVVSEFGDDVRSRLLVYDKDFVVQNTIDITPDIDYIQGNYYDNVNDLYFVWGTKKDSSVSSSNGVLKSFNSAGAEQSSIDVPSYFGTPASSIDFAADGECWIAIPNIRIERVTVADFAVQETRTLKVTEGLFVASDGTVYLTKNENISIYNSSDVLLLNTEMKTDETEGIIVDKWGSVWHNRDKYTHGAVPDGNRVSKYILDPLIPD